MAERSTCATSHRPAPTPCHQAVSAAASVKPSATPVPAGATDLSMPPRASLLVAPCRAVSTAPRAVADPAARRATGSHRSLTSSAPARLPTTAATAASRWQGFPRPTAKTATSRFPRMIPLGASAQIRTLPRAPLSQQGRTVTEVRAPAKRHRPWKHLARRQTPAAPTMAAAACEKRLQGRPAARQATAACSRRGRRRVPTQQPPEDGAGIGVEDLLAVTPCATPRRRLGQSQPHKAHRHLRPCHSSTTNSTGAAPAKTSHPPAAQQGHGAS
mmetsp:Transcript_44224/g.127810  ORF Transcript_44224/g.127810 Transcript_44224/m.127810 type:complete len:272 (+) Transcript_44224:1954-2769(+)